MLAGQLIEGGVSLTVTVKVQSGSVDAPDSLQDTVVVPMGKNDPDGGEQVIVPQVSPLAVGAG